MPGLRDRLHAHLAQAQHRNAYCLVGNNVLAAATGLLFWFLFARVLELPAAEVGAGYAIVSLATIVGVLAKGGLDTALLRSLPESGHADAQRTYGFALAVGILAALAFTALIAVGSLILVAGYDSAPLGWALVAVIAVLLVATWLQDARFLAMGDARPSLKRNLALSGARIVMPVAVVVLALPRPVALSLALALAVSWLVGLVLERRLRDRSPEPGIPAPTRRAFLATALRNTSGSAAEFLPGLLLVPIVFAAAGPESAAYFGMAWTAASLLFLASSALGRSALAEMVRRPAAKASCLRRAALQHLAVVLPVAVVAAAAAPFWLSFFGPAYAETGHSTLRLLACSIVLVAPGNIYLAVLRARDSPIALAAFPAAMVAVLVVLAPLFLQWWGLPGVAIAWMVANLPLAVVAVWQLPRQLKDPAPAERSAAGTSEAATESIAVGGAP